MNSVVEVGWKYDIVKAVTCKLLRISKNPAFFWSIESLIYYIIEENLFEIWDLVRITKFIYNP